MLHLRDMSQNITGHFKSQQKDIFVKAIYINLNTSNEKITNVKVVGDILRFPKSQRSYPWDKN